MYLVIIYIFGSDTVSFYGKDFIKYLIGASIFSLLLPFVVNLGEHMVSIEVKKNGKK